MAHTNPEDRRAYGRNYQIRRYHARKNVAIQQLGGVCVKCGSVERLELDHIDPKTKSFDISAMWATASWRFEKELAKCQLLCRSCHTLKTIEEKGQSVAKGTHGTLSAYRYCKCEKCREAKRKANRLYKMNHKGM